jgi:hypothetical protein
MDRLGARHSAFWPEDDAENGRALFSPECLEERAQRTGRERIADRYGAIEFRAGSAVGRTPRLPSLGITGVRLLALADPAEYARYRRAVLRDEQLRGGERGDAGAVGRRIIVSGGDHDDADEAALLLRLGLTLAEAKLLVAAQDAKCGE